MTQRGKAGERRKIVKFEVPGDDVEEVALPVVTKVPRGAVKTPVVPVAKARPTRMPAAVADTIVSSWDQENTLGPDASLNNAVSWEPSGTKVASGTINIEYFISRWQVIFSVVWRLKYRNMCMGSVRPFPSPPPILIMLILLLDLVFFYTADYPSTIAIELRRKLPRSLMYAPLRYLHVFRHESLDVSPY